MSKKSNGFMNFMFIYKAQVVASGRNPDMGAITVEAGEIWEKMSADEKSKYKARKMKETEYVPKQEVVPSLYNCNGMSLKEMERKKNEKHLIKQRMELTIEDILLTAIDKNELETLNFFFISVSYFLKRSNGDIWPCEMALSQFNIRDGLLDTYHTLIDPGKTPIGFAAEVINFSKETHQMGVEDVAGAENSFEKLFDKISNFIGFTQFTTKAIPPIYTGLSASDIDAVKATLDQMAVAKGYDFNAFRVYPIESLLFKLQKKIVAINQDQGNLEPIEPLGSIVYARNCFDRDEYAYSEIGCKFHNDKDQSQHCCLSKVKRWAYIFSKYCVNKRFPLIPGQHYPEVYQGVQDVELTDSETCLSEPIRRLQIHTTGTSDSETECPSLVTRKSSCHSNLQSNDSRNNWIKRLIQDQNKRK